MLGKAGRVLQTDKSKGTDAGTWPPQGDSKKKKRQAQGVRELLKSARCCQMTWQEKCLASDTGYPVGQCFLKVSSRNPGCHVRGA